MELARTELVDNVKHPKHYADSCSLECIEVMELTFGVVATFNFCLLNAFKYLWRYKNKNGKEDIKKAQWYLKKAQSLSANYMVEYPALRTEKLEMLENLWADIADKEGVEYEI